MIFIFVVEIFALSLLIDYKKALSNLNEYIFPLRICKNKFRRSFDRVDSILLVFSIFIITFILSLVITNLSSILYFNDPINSWIGRWAITWANNVFPIDSRHYPQLFPTNVSLNFVFLHGQILESISKLVMPLFPVGILLIFLDLGFSDRFKLFATGLIIYGFILFIFYGIIFIADANADIPVSFFAFLSFYVIEKQDKFEFNPWTILLVIVFTSSAANTKLVGVSILGLSFLWMFYYIYLNRREITKSQIIKTLFFVFLIMIGNMFWYIIKPASMALGLDASMYLPASYILRFQNAMNMLYYSFGPPLAILLLFFVINSLFSKDYSHITLFLIFPVLLFWAFFFSYDFRNISVAIPFIALISAVGLREFLFLLFNKFSMKGNKELKKPFVFSKQIDVFYIRSIYGKRIFTLILIVCCLLFIFIRTEAFFQILIELSYFLNAFYFEYYRVVYTIEIGYYKFVEYYVLNSQIFLILILIFIIVIINRIRNYQILIFIFTTILLLNFTILDEKNMNKIQQKEYSMVEVRNIYYRIYSNTKYIDKLVILYSNSLLFNELNPPPGIALKKIVLLPKFLKDNIDSNRNERFFLLNSNYLSQEDTNLLKQLIADKSLKLIFNEGNYLFLKDL